MIEYEELPAEVRQYEQDVLSGKIEVEDTPRNRAWTDALKDEQRTRNVNSIGEVVNGIFGGLLKPADVTATKPQNKPNYTPYLVGGILILVLIILLKNAKK